MSVPLITARVTDVLEEFGPAGGASIELVAWELCCEVSEVRDAWAALLADRRLARCSVDPASGEVMYRLA